MIYRLMIHQPVLLKEVLYYLNPLPRENFIDCTIGFGGHALAILEKIKPEGKILGIEADFENLKQFELRTKNHLLRKNLILVQENFKNLRKIVEQNNFHPVKGILLDLGMSSWQIEESGRGFSFQKNEPLLMNYESRIMNDQLTAERIINQWSEDKLRQIFLEYGEERYAQRIAKLICQVRKVRLIKTTSQLVEIIRQAVPAKYRFGRLHFATRAFQALRLAVNDELNNLKKALPQALDILEPDGRLVVISFHSLEDRIVKNFFRQYQKENYLEILTKKPIRPIQEEIKLNPRSRSAKLRAALRI